ncbi:competence protein ComEC [Parasphingorhabdus marina DSM 22363]|uniref:Competence protein ComEC n=1 Tax=Parasphingorhabdus marina DSM 22363 TaxID=1123272 RepID=A0A1N6FZJ3_9SPHN|nr:ComEC/Rec2 family competence protein [Parasphingorhabdus marina]SIO00698.1 competence protein ComEC [Parasphingorhabdus marina DSM 22363]
MAISRRQLPESIPVTSVFQRLEKQLERERDQLPLWVPVALGIGVAAWFLAASIYWWLALVAVCLAIIIFCARPARTYRAARAMLWAALLIAAGCLLVWGRSLMVAAPVLEGPAIASFHGEITGYEEIPSRNQIRLMLNPLGSPRLPPKVRVNLPLDQADAAMKPGAIIALRARLMPPAMAALPGAYNFAQRAWFQGLGATGQVLGKVEIIRPAEQPAWISDYRQRLSRHVQSRMADGTGAIGATLATGDRGAISEADADSMRNSGLAHLLSISGLHVTAVVGAFYLVVLKTLALVPILALRWRLPLVAAGFAAIAAISYTLLTGAQVPTIRACVAALLVLAALMLGRSAFTLRMVAAGALFVLVFWPETLMGPSFQLSFAAVTAIIALHEHPVMQRWLAPREENYLRRIRRIVLSLFCTGLVVELALMPIALYHFHKAGLYGALANIVAIPLTTFVIMPLEALALLLDLFGLGGPVWWLCEKALAGLISLAHFVSTRPGAVTWFPTVPRLSFALVIAGGLWLLLWREKWRYGGLVPMLIGTVMMVTARPADLYITGDGRHLALRTNADSLVMLRTRSGEFISDMIRENAGVTKAFARMDDWPGARCNADSCTILVARMVGGIQREWTLVALRSRHYIPEISLAAACRRADIVVSERRLPRSCQPRWIKADRRLLSRTGGLTIDLVSDQVETVRGRSGNHVWMRFVPP